MKRILCVVLSFIILVTQTNIVEANSSKEQVNVDTETAEYVINQYREDVNCYYSVRDYIQLRSFVDGEEKYTLYMLEPYGYAILYNETYGFMEACYRETKLISNFDMDDTYYYGGPGNYFGYESGKFVSLVSNEVLETDEMKKIADLEHVVHSNERLQTNLRKTATYAVGTQILTRDVEPEYFANLDEDEHGYNENGTCTVIAACILFGYYDEYRNDAYVPDKYRSGNGTNDEFHKYVNGKVYGQEEEGGIYIRDALAGFNSYLAERELNTRMYSVYSTPNDAVKKAMNRLLMGYPVIASMGKGYDAPYNHTVVIYGMKYNSTTGLSSGVGVFRINMGWSSDDNSVYATSSWFYECGYIV